ncbi:uncharacterized protein LOC123508923 [Portunus trituberculatus]|uniref:uncharacterized protein LOC123508923 n=1 Tax=Portunus trituberculatus TaxID=210409 RepID=UPI001E1CB114|nr:uncharacterized protein LOC123508923 [Portunus trituberculatus]
MRTRSVQLVTSWWVVCVWAAVSLATGLVSVVAVLQPAWYVRYSQIHAQDVQGVAFQVMVSSVGPLGFCRLEGVKQVTVAEEDRRRVDIGPPTASVSNTPPTLPTLSTSPLQPSTTAATEQPLETPRLEPSTPPPPTDVTRDPLTQEVSPPTTLFPETDPSPPASQGVGSSSGVAANGGSPLEAMNATTVTAANNSDAAETNTSDEILLTTAESFSGDSHSEAEHKNFKTKESKSTTEIPETPKEENNALGIEVANPSAGEEQEGSGGGGDSRGGGGGGESKGGGGGGGGGGGVGGGVLGGGGGGVGTGGGGGRRGRKGGGRIARPGTHGGARGAVGRGNTTAVTRGRRKKGKHRRRKKKYNRKRPKLEGGRTPGRSRRPPRPDLPLHHLLRSSLQDRHAPMASPLHHFPRQEALTSTDYRPRQPILSCSGVGGGVGSGSSAVWALVGVLYGVAGVVQAVVGVASLAMHLPHAHSRRFTLAAWLGNAQVVIVMSQGVALVLFPLGLGSPLARGECGGSSSVYWPGECTFGWSYMLGVVATTLAAYCPCLARLTVFRKYDYKEWDSINFF